jgi:spoIIIJ-associated protein
MEWVETTAKTVEEAKEKALDQLGVAMDDAEFDVLDEPKPGLFGRTRGEARVRARVRPTQARQKVERRDRRKTEKSSKRAAGATAVVDAATDADADATPVDGTAVDGNGAATTESAAKGAGNGRARAKRPSKSNGAAAAAAPAAADVSAPDVTPRPTTEPAKEQHVDAHQVGEEARRFLTGLLDAFGLEGEVELNEDGDDLELHVNGQELGLLVGPRGTTLQAVQDLARVASQRRLGDHDTRLRLDIGGYRERRKVALGRFATQMADEVKSSGVARVLEPMSSADRRIIHDTLSEVDGISTRSEGDDPHRRVIITPAND